MLQETPINNILEGQEYRVYVTLKTADGEVNTDDFDVYGGATDGRYSPAFSVSTTGEPGKYLVTIPALSIHHSTYYTYQICTRRKSTGHEWLVLHGTIKLTARVADIDYSKIGTPQMEATSTLAAESYAVTNENMAGIQGEKGEKGDRGFSAYEVARQNGFEGTEEEWLESLKHDAAAEATAAAAEYVRIAEKAARDALDAQILAEVAAMNTLEAKQKQEEQA